MRDGIDEADWKRLQRLKPILLERLCQRIVEEIERVAAVKDAGWHQRYLDIYKLVQRKDEDIDCAFNDWRRSTAIWRLLAIRNLGLLTDEELCGFTNETQAKIAFITRPFED